MDSCDDTNHRSMGTRHTWNPAFLGETAFESFLGDIGLAALLFGGPAAPAGGPLGACGWEAGCCCCLAAFSAAFSFLPLSADDTARCIHVASV